uniref:Nucleoporin NUP42 n=1 Tax=Arion vulgaris TaxID=1028688 RepID=A0A0B7AGD6_9EUPU
MSVPVCRYYILNKKCNFGKHCRYLHSTSQGPPVLLDTKDENHEEHLEDSYYPASVTLDLQDTQKSLSNIQNEVLSEDPVDLLAQDFQNQDHTDTSHHDKHAVEIVNEKLSKPINKTKTICYFFKTYGNCRNGKECRFFHILSENEHSYKNIQSKKQHGQFSDIPPRFQKTEDQEEFHTSRKSVLHEDMRSRHAETHYYKQSSRGHMVNDSRGSSYTERRVCNYFIRGHCSKGDYCKFVHPSNCISEKKTTASKPSKPEYKNEKVEDGNPKAEGDDKPHGPNERACSANGNRPTNNSVSQPLIMKRMLTYSELENIDIKKVRDSELNVIKKRFPQDKINVLEDTDSNFSAIIVFSPTDPDWMFDIHEFQLEIIIPLDYPRKMMSVLLPLDQSLPETVRRYVEISIKEWLNSKTEQLAADGKVELVFRPFLLWLDRNIEDITMEALKQLKRDLLAKASGMEFISAEKLQAKFRTQSQLSADKEDKIHSDDGDAHQLDSCASEDSSDNSLDDFDDKHMAQTLSIDPEKKGTEIELRHLQLRENAAALMFERLKLVLQCGRCKNHSDLVLPPGKVMSVKCEKCSQSQFVHFRAALIHQFSSVVGYLDVDGCQAFDLIFQECRVAVTCMSCSKQTRINGLVSGHMVDAWCQACNARFKLATEAVKFVQLVPSSVDTSVNKIVEVASSKVKKPPKDAAIREGYPLPEFGTCKHFKHSYRWLRFPCCGKAYACDICHDKKEDHDMVYATRMICGHCCREQNFSVTKPCSSCGQHLTKIRTAHWEGGSGCRDKISMSKSDQQKFKNMNKTLSNHKKKLQNGAQKKVTKLRHT